MMWILSTAILILLQTGHLMLTDGCEILNCKPADCYESRGTWKCYKCHNSFLLESNNYYCTSCPDSCDSCDGSQYCSGCWTGYFGSSCQHSCLNCVDDFCDQNTGCTNGCKRGYYKDTDYICKQCLPACSECSNSYSCSVCSASTYWGPACQYSCDHCYSCRKSDGCWYGCEDGYYRVHNSIKQGYECKECSQTCTSCNAENSCQSCMQGYWGSACQNYCPDSCSECTSNTDCSACKSGYWGSSCQHNCSGCLITCSKSNGCTNGCKAGYYLEQSGIEYYCNKCLEPCKTCSDGSSCSSCPTGFVGLWCQHNCNGCNGQICSNVTGKCTYECSADEYFKMDGVNIGCVKCPAGCSSCYSDFQCTACIAGKWGYTCTDDCPENCKNLTCGKSSGYCSHGCVDGFFDVRCLSNCSPGCKSCNNNAYCEKCKEKYYSRENNQKCECNANNCSRSDGTTCAECYLKTWYPESSGCCPCSSNCKDNVCSTGGTCIDCVDSKYGPNCDFNCWSGCKDSLCYRNGSCISCLYDWRYGPTCNRNCQNTIYHCNTCYGLSSDSLTCTHCLSGWYAEGDKCTACSSHCKNRNDGYPKCNGSSGVCTTECDKGWFGERCDCNVSGCAVCFEEDANRCLECSNDFYNMSVSLCNPCPSKCLTGSTCNKYNGSCTAGCEDHWTGVQCDVPCPDECIKCSQFNKSSCSLCQKGLYGDGCQNACNTECVAQDESQTCDKDNGRCIHGCNEAFWGDHCDKRCGDGCSGKMCNRTTGVCLSDCDMFYYGPLCDEQCSIHCGNTSGRMCDIINGTCLEDCTVGWFGDQCNDRCSENCKDNDCYRNNGSCSAGCTSGYSGSTCMQALQSEAPSNTAAIGGGVGVGVAILIIIVVAVLVILRKRKASSKFDAREGSVSRKQQLSSNNADQGPVYSNIADIGDQKESSNVPGVSNLLYANAPVRMSDLSETGDPTIPLVASKTVTRPSSVDYLKEVELEEGEVIDDDETDQSGEVDNTYYNVGGKRVAVAQLAEYIKHKSERDLFNDFSQLPTGLLKAHKEARKAKNAAKNRYKAIYPYDENRVVLQDGGGDYMNASYMDGFNRTKEYIASSGPFKKSYETTHDFWRMIWQEKCETIVMLTKPIENKQPKCEKYWPEAGENSSYGNIHISCLTEDLYADFAIRILTVTKGQESFNIHHVHFTAWPDKGIPHDVTSMIEFIQKVRSIHKVKNTPMLVHCSAGIGRTGTFIVLDMLTYEGEDRGSVDIFGSVASLRYQRCNMVQTPEQYVYLHHAVLHSLTFDCRSIPGDMFLQNYNKLIERNGGERKIDIQFQQLQSISEEMTDEERAEKARNKGLANKNRNDADIPADENRVKLMENRKPGSSDYINAVYINSFRKRRKFIAAQSPLPSTVIDFLSLVWQEKCGCIVSMEDPDIQDKTVKIYWPADNQVVKHGVFKVTCKDSKTTGNYMTKKLSITYHGPKGEESRDVNLFIVTNWPKGSSVPKSSDSLLELVKTVDILNRKSGSEPPILIHCRTGAERSCIFCAVSGLIEKMEIEHELSVVNTIRQIKARRLKAFSTVEEYKFCYQAVISYLKSFEIYSNFQLKETEA